MHLSIVKLKMLSNITNKTQQIKLKFKNIIHFFSVLKIKVTDTDKDAKIDVLFLVSLRRDFCILTDLEAAVS